jgi:glycosyltransferase involved in cell wall biosynthesis
VVQPDEARVSPRVSICVPNLNTRPYLEDRFRTIFEQTCQDWELLVYDSYSTDGAWEYIRDVASADARIRAWQGPREGAPGSWTPCIREARGEYVYIATSDDTMAPDCLEKLAAALDAHPGCDLAHCQLRIIDERGRDLPDWWRERSLFANSSGPLIDRPHVRKAPYDGLLHLVGETVYISITQLLIRRSLFGRIGMFTSAWGSISDFAWDMRAGLVGSTVHVPDTWGGWRVHPSQATAGAGIGSPEHAVRVESMIEDAIGACRTLLPAEVERRLAAGWLERVKDYRQFDRESSGWHRSLRNLAVVGQRVLEGSPAARAHVGARLRGTRQAPWRDSFPKELLAWLEYAGVGPVFQALDQQKAPTAS